MRGAFVCLGFIFPVALQAQMPAQSIYYGSQWATYYQRQWQKSTIARKAIPPGGIPMTFSCKAASLDQASLWELGDDFLKRNRWEEAERAFRACIFTDSAFCDPYFRLVQCLTVKNDLVQALHILRITERKFPGEPMVYLSLGQVLLLAGSPQEGLSSYEQFTKLAPDGPEGFLGCSIALSELGRQEEAIDCLAKAKLTQTFDLWTGILYYKNNETQKAIVQLKNPSLYFTQGLTGTEKWRKYFLGLSYFAKGESYYPEAKQALQEAAHGGISLDSMISKTLGLSIDPTNLKSLALLEFYDDEVNCEFDRKSKSAMEEADLFFENRNLKRAQELYAKIIRDDSLNCHAYVKLAECYQRQNEWVEALNLYRTAHQKNPSEKIIGLLLARQWFRLDSLSAALSTYREIIQLFPQDDRAYIGAGLVLAHQGKTDEGLRCLMQRDNRNGYTPWNLLSKTGILYYYAGDVTKAMQYLKRASYHENNASINYYLGLCYYSHGKKFADRAKERMSRALELGAVVSPQIVAQIGLDTKAHKGPHFQP